MLQPLHRLQVESAAISVRKQVWITSKGDKREAWIVDYRDAEGDRCIETFAKKKNADARQVQIKVDVRAASMSPTARARRLKRRPAIGLPPQRTAPNSNTDQLNPLPLGKLLRISASSVQLPPLAIGFDGLEVSRLRLAVPCLIEWAD